jgi:outer membrane protein OmpA-like peptidoglycan-associated protein
VSLDELERGNPIEAVGGLQFQLPADLIAQVGAGTGLNAAVGSPALRLFASLSYTPFGEKDVDTDGDGLLDSVDQCPTEPEDIDQFEDEDGCPDPDNDGDNILDVDDSCPNEAGIPELQGCPPVDTDGDGFQDHVDKCPNEPGIEELEGCPAVDTDGDGIFDHKDKCPNEPGIEELEGCPAVDADGDGIPDHKDKCPDEPGLPELEGCPKDGPKVVVTETEIRISETIYFDTGKATIQARSFNLLDTVAFVLKRHSKITGVRIEGHTDDVGKDASNLELSKARAKSVRDYLVSKGIEEARLSSEGYGESQPKADIKGLRGKDLREARALNRRVEFRITEIDGKNVEASDSIIIKEETTVEE